MKDYNFFKSEFIKKHQNIDNEYYLDKYINFFISYKINEEVDYIERHHILPRSVFPEYENESWNIIKLDYDSHRLAHLWLFKSINDRKYQRPLNWMMNYYKNKIETSNASKKAWINFKLNKDKYDNWLKKRSEYMKILSSEEQRRRANIFWKNITEEKYDEFSKKMKEYWTEEKKIEKSKQMLDFYSKPENKEKKSEEAKRFFESRTEEEIMKFKEKMNIVNKDYDKREDASKKIKLKWKDPEYLYKMEKRPRRKGLPIKVIFPDGKELVFEYILDMSREFNFTTHLIRKYKDKNIEIIEEHLTEKNLILKGCKIEKIK